MSAEHMDAHGAIDPLLSTHVDETEPIEIPEDFVPTRAGWTASQIAGVATGTTLLIVTTIAFGLGVAVTNGWIRP